MSKVVTHNGQIVTLEGKALEVDATSVTVDSELSSTSENPVQNKVVTAELDKKVAISQGTENAGKLMVVGTDGNITTQTTSDMNIILGVAPSGDMTITANGTYDVTAKAQAIVNVPSSGGAELTAIEVYVADLIDATSYTISKGAVDGYKRQVTA